MMLRITISKMIQRDNYFNGADPDTVQDFGVIDVVTVTDGKMLKDYIEKNYDFLRNMAIHENALEYCSNEDQEGNQIKLSDTSPDGWLVDYSFHIENVTTSRIEGAELYNLMEGKPKTWSWDAIRVLCDSCGSDTQLFKLKDETLCIECMKIKQEKE